MAIRFDALNDRLYLTSGLPAAFTAFTAFFRIKNIGNGGTSDSRWFWYGSTNFAAYTQLGWVDGTDRRLVAYSQAGSGYADTLGTFAFTIGTWYDIAVSQSGTTATVYYGTSGDKAAMASMTLPAGSPTPGNITFGDAVLDQQWPDVALDDIRIWSSALTAAQLERERARRIPGEQASLHTWFPTIFADKTSALVDRTGSGRAWTEGGTLTVEDGAPVSWGAPIQTLSTRVIPVLSLPGVNNITTTAATPKVTLAY